ncbi:MAG: glycosyltransferase family 4 protein [Planctomycetaceae bacterium]|nr:glycosyltransferase family 4 protein [Planctomycetaceae bacterium]
MLPGSRVVHITTVHNPLDVRIFHKECLSLVEAGCNVSLICCHDRDEIVDGVQLRAVPKPSGRLRRLTVTQWYAFSAALRERAEIYHLHDPELMPLGIALKLLGKRVVLDVHEDYRQKIWEKLYLSYPLRLTLSWIVGRIEDICGLMFNGIVTVTPHIARYFPKRKTALVRNYPEYGEFELQNPPPYSDRPNNIAYIGSITANRGAWRMLKAVHKLNEESHLNAKLILAGPIGTPELEAELRASPEWASVDFRGFLTRQGIGEVLANSRVGILVLDATPCYVNAYPMKLFEYMAAALPVVASDFPVWREIVDGAQCGISINPMDVEGIAQTVKHLLENPQEAEQMGRRGKDAAHKLYFWEREAETLVIFYRRILKLQ